MERLELIKLEDEIKQILIDNPKARDDDMYLYAMYCVKKHPRILNDYDDLFYQIFVDNHTRKKYNIKTFSAVERVRRKIQEEYPELVNEKTKKVRAEKEEEYKEYSRI